MSYHDIKYQMIGISVLTETHIMNVKYTHTETTYEYMYIKTDCHWHCT